MPKQTKTVDDESALLASIADMDDDEAAAIAASEVEAVAAAFEIAKQVEALTVELEKDAEPICVSAPPMPRDELEKVQKQLATSLAALERIGRRVEEVDAYTKQLERRFADLLKLGEEMRRESQQARKDANDAIVECDRRIRAMQHDLDASSQQFADALEPRELRRRLRE